MEYLGYMALSAIVSLVTSIILDVLLNGNRRDI